MLFVARSRKQAPQAATARAGRRHVAGRAHRTAAVGHVHTPSPLYPYFVTGVLHKACLCAPSTILPQHSLFLTAPRVVLPQDPGTGHFPRTRLTPQCPRSTSQASGGGTGAWHAGTLCGSSRSSRAPSASSRFAFSRFRTRIPACYP